MDLNVVEFGDLLSEGVPVHVSAHLVEERKKAGVYKDWVDFQGRLFYGMGSQPGGVRPADGLLLRHIKGCFIPVASISSESDALQGSNDKPTGGMRMGNWWDWSEQSGSAGTREEEWRQDDAFPAGKAACMHAVERHCGAWKHGHDLSLEFQAEDVVYEGLNEVLPF